MDICSYISSGGSIESSENFRPDAGSDLMHTGVSIHSDCESAKTVL